jgi:HPt (histidine-containing phosphotransfer) domain-containing protein
LATLRELGPQDGQGLLPAAAEAFRQGVPNSLAALQHALDSRHWDVLEQAAHKLRGAAASIGATGAAALCQELEQLGRQPDVRADGRPGTELLDRLGAELVRVDAALESALALRP